MSSYSRIPIVLSRLEFQSLVPGRQALDADGNRVLLLKMQDSGGSRVLGHWECVDRDGQLVKHIGASLRIISNAEDVECQKT